MESDRLDQKDIKDEMNINQQWTYCYSVKT